MKSPVITPTPRPFAQAGLEGALTMPESGETRQRETQSASTMHVTRRQLEVLSLLCEGLPNKLIARRLDISAATVKAHVGSILRELGVANRLQAVVAARRLRLVDEGGLRSGQSDEAQLADPPPMVRFWDEVAARHFAVSRR